MERIHVPQDIHHLWYPRRELTTPLNKRLRNHAPFLVQGPMRWHTELHANVMNPPKLPPELVYGLLEAVQETEVGTTQGLELAIEFFREIRDTSRHDVGEIAFEALSQQLYYLRGYHRDAA